MRAWTVRAARPARPPSRAKLDPPTELEAARQELREALERQTAASEILRIISRRTFDLHEVFEAIVERAWKLCHADHAWIWRFGEHSARVEAYRGDSPDALRGLEDLKHSLGQDATDVSPSARAYREKRPIHIPDLLAEPDAAGPRLTAIGARTTLSVPLVVEDVVVGIINLARVAVRPFTPDEIALAANFADQAVIAIENVRLFNETKEALERQTATSEVLRVISTSTSDVQPVFDAIVQKANVLCQAEWSLLWLAEADGLHIRAHEGGNQEFLSFHRDTVRTPSRDSVVGRTALLGVPVQIPDVLADPEYTRRDDQQLGGYRTLLGIPIHQGGQLIGVITLARNEVRPFAEAQIGVVRTFADQAAIAIENVRLFNETKEALEQQTATADVLKVINRRALDLPAVLETVVAAAGRLCDADVGWLNQTDDHIGDLPGERPDPTRWVSGRWSRVGAYWGRTSELQEQAYTAFTRVKPIGALFPMYRETATSLAILDRRVVNVPDWTTEPDLRASGFARALNARALLAVPLVREGEVIGAIALARLTRRVFGEREVALAQTFADQAAIAIENVRLFRDLEHKSRELEAASRHKSEFLANMSHELRTPLNAIIGFSDVLEQQLFGGLNDKQSEYVKDISSSGKHLLDLVNEILDLSKVEAGRMELECSEFAISDTVISTFNFVRERAARHGIRLQADVPSDLGTITADERKVRQVLLNLLSNAVKFTPDGGQIAVTARRADGEVRISVRDTGVGIAPADPAKVFEEFRQVGKRSDRSREGTGLGLTLAKRFVELHGGRIWLESELGEGTTFTFAIPAERALTD